MMDELQIFFDDFTTVHWVVLVCLLYLSVFTHKAIKILKEIRSEQ